MFIEIDDFIAGSEADEGMRCKIVGICGDDSLLTIIQGYPGT
jgi:hypothetical protein